MPNLLLLCTLQSCQLPPSVMQCTIICFALVQFLYYFYCDNVIHPYKPQESIRNSADGSLLSTPESLVVSISKTHGFDSDELSNAATVTSTPRKSRSQNYGIDGLDSLKFTYKVHS